MMKNEREKRYHPGCQMEDIARYTEFHSISCNSSFFSFYASIPAFFAVCL